MTRRIVHLIDTGGPGGAETVFSTLVERLDGGDWDSVPVVPEAGWLEDHLEAAGREPVRLTPGGSFDLEYALRLVRLFRRLEADLVQTHLLGSSLYGGIAARICRIPVVSTFHGTVDVAPDSLRDGVKMHLVLRNSDHVVFVSESLRDRFVSGGSSVLSRTEVIHNGIDPETFAARGDGSFRREIGVEEGQFLIGAVGNLRPAKNYELFLRAAARIREDGAGEYRFVIVGEGHGRLREKLLALREDLGLRDVVKFAGFREDVPRILADLDLYLLTSSSEGFSLSLVQAMASGLPVVSTRCGGPEEIISDGVHGRLVDGSRPEDVAEAVLGLAEDPEMARRLGREARRHVGEVFSVERMVEAYDALYRRCLQVP